MQEIEKMWCPRPFTKIILLHTDVVSHYTHPIKIASLVKRGGGGGFQNAQNKLL